MEKAIRDREVRDYVSVGLSREVGGVVLLSRETVEYRFNWDASIWEKVGKSKRSRIEDTLEDQDTARQPKRLRTEDDTGHQDIVADERVAKRQKSGNQPRTGVWGNQQAEEERFSQLRMDLPACL